MKSILLFIMFTFTTQSVLASSASVLFSKGINHKITSVNKKRILSKGMKIFADDTIYTEQNGFIILKIDGHSMIRIEEDSQVIVSELPVFNQETKDLDEGGSFLLKIGTILVDVEKEFDTEAFNVKTSNSIFGVRGTKFLVSRDSDTLITVNSGTVEVVNTLTNQSDFVEKDESIHIEKDMNFTARQKYKITESIDWNVRAEKRKTKFKNLRANLKREFKKKRKRWKKNSKRTEQFKKKWNKKRASFLKKRGLNKKSPRPNNSLRGKRKQGQKASPLRKNSNSLKPQRNKPNRSKSRNNKPRP